MKLVFEDPDIECEVRKLGDVIVARQMLDGDWRLKMHVNGAEVHFVTMVDFARGVADRYITNENGRFVIIKNESGTIGLKKESFSLENATITFKRFTLERY